MDRVRGLLLDIDGVLVTSWKPLPRAVETLEWLRDEGVPFLLATNTTTMSRASLARRLNAAGFDVEAADLVTAPAITGAYLRAHHANARVFLVATGDAVDDLGDISLVDADADVVVLAGADDAFSYANLNRAFRMLRAGAHLVAMHRNTWWMTADGPQLDSGPFVSALEQATGVAAAVVGKPSPDFFAQAVDVLGVDRAHVAMVGDDLDNDVVAAQAAGITGILVRTGKFTEEALASARTAPDNVIDSIADLPELLSRDA